MSNPRFDQVKDRLFFIVGCGRSGTTLLKTILNAHPNVSIPHETFFFNSIARGDIHSEVRPQTRIQKIVSCWWIREMNVTEEGLREALGDRCPTWPNLLVALLCETTDHEATRIGEKTVGHLLFVDQLLKLYPSCRVIQIIRDPRAVLASFRSSSVGSSFAAKIIRDWSKAIEVDRQHQTRSRYSRIRFEDLLLDTRGTLEQLCEFLELPFSESMLEFHNRQDKGFSDLQPHHQNTTKKIFTSGIDAWQSKLSRSSVALLEHYLGASMCELGYEVSGDSLEYPKVRFWLSSFADVCHRHLVRRPKELVKRIRATLKVRRTSS